VLTLNDLLSLETDYSTGARRHANCALAAMCRSISLLRNECPPGRDGLWGARGEGIEGILSHRNLS
jgi:hypothetical protein